MPNKNVFWIVVGLMIASFLVLVGYAMYGMQLRTVMTEPARPVPTAPPATGSGQCVTGGCSGQICQDAGEEPAITDCMYRAEYACYRTARCERQTDGKCGWTQTNPLTFCLQNPPAIK